MHCESIIARRTGIAPHQVAAVVRLLADGATIPFIARYRKEATGSLDEVQIYEVQKALKQCEELDKRRATILKTIEEQGKLTDELRRRIVHCWDATELEDIYLPYKPKRRTRATVAKEKGLEPLAQMLFAQGEGQVVVWAARFVSEQVTDVDEALCGARDIIAEWISEDEGARKLVRAVFQDGAVVHAKVAKGKEAAGAKYKDYFAFEEPLARIPSHRLLAIRRGEEEGFLRVKIAPDEVRVIERLERRFLRKRNEAAEQVRLALHDSYKRLLQPSIETEFRKLAKERADREAIEVFASNLRQLLLAPPLGPKTVLAIDPGYRTGCKVVCLNASGDLMHHTAIFPHPPQQEVNEAKEVLRALVQRFAIEAIAVGNGTAGRETLALCRSISFDRPVEVFMVNEAGASVYSASEVAREEFPDQDVTVRGAISIGRRLMDPLAELVKIDPKSIGVGQYQHDVNQVWLHEALEREIESCVNAVGINLNTASKHLLTYVSGLGPVLAQNIVAYRKEHGPFRSRQQLKKVPRLGEKAFEQAAGFLRIRDGEHPLDNTAVHPERYSVVERMATQLGVTIEVLIADASLRKKIHLEDFVTEEVGLPTLRDIMRELAKPGLDPRGKAKPFNFGDVHAIEDLQPGMVLPGIVTNITNFGVFVDVGVKQDGLVHISQLANHFVRNPAEVVQLQQQVKVRVIEVDLARKRIQLSMKDV